jgi:hypothetical protein
LHHLCPGGDFIVAFYGCEGLDIFHLAAMRVSPRAISPILALRQRSVDMPYRILSLDGGGAWALIEVETLIALYSEDTKGHDVLDDFDLVAANSGGSLVLGGLVENLTLGGLRDLFLDETKRRAIFSPTKLWGDRALHDLTGIGPKYSAAAKLQAIERQLPNTGASDLATVVKGIRRPGNVDVHLLIIGFDYDRNRATFFRSAPASNQQGWGTGDTSGVTLAEAIHASTNAPVNYFDGPAELPHQLDRYWDGGLTGNNNPVLAAVTEALVLNQRPSDIVALSLGTATVFLPLAKPGEPRSPFTLARAESTLVGDLRKLATSILDDPPDAASFIAHAITGGPVGVASPADSRIVRMNPLISPLKADGDGWAAPSGMTAAQFQYLCTLDMDAVEQAEVQAIADYARLWLGNRARNQPIRMDGDTLEREVGYDWFSEARDAWKAIR